MDADLSSFLARHAPVDTETVTWGHQMRLRVSAYLGREMPPLRYVTSVRAVVLRGDQALVQRDRDSRHVLPGGRREGEELPEAALRREVGEETGWSLSELTLLGFMRFHHLSPKPPDYPYPYPDFCQIVYRARATAFSADARVDDGYEVETGFMSIAAVGALALSRRERIYLEAALRAVELVEIR